VKLLFLAFVFVLIGCGDNEKWTCTCDVSCDGVEDSVTVNACGTEEEADKAVNDATDECLGELEDACLEARCACECSSSGDSC